MECGVYQNLIILTKTRFPAVQDHRLQFVDYVNKQGLVIFVALSFRRLGQDFLRNHQVQQQ